MKKFLLLVSLFAFFLHGRVLGVEAIEGDALAGQGKVGTCIACHGQDGNSQNDLYPSIAGQNFRYLLRELKAIQSGQRSAPLMTGQLDNLSEQDLADMAAFYAQQTPALGGADGDEALLVLGEQIYRGGLLERNIAACAACHSPRGEGNRLAGFPRLSGQLPAYTIKSLEDYRSRARGNESSFGLIMQQNAARLNDREIKALANYLYGLH